MPWYGWVVYGVIVTAFLTGEWLSDRRCKRRVEEARRQGRIAICR